MSSGEDDPFNDPVILIKLSEKIKISLDYPGICPGRSEQQRESKNVLFPVCQTVHVLAI